MNNIFEKNLSALKLKNPKLAEAISLHVLSEMPKLVQENGAYNIFYKEKFVHNQQSPLGEAQEIFFRAQNSPVAIHVIYGLGLGYLFQVASANSKGTIILYEPDLNLLWFAFTLVDFSQDIMKKNVYIASDFDTVAEYLHKKSGMDNTPELLSLPSQRAYDPLAFEDLVKKFKDLIGTFVLNLKFTKEKFYPSLKFLLRNIRNLKKEIPLLYNKDILKGKTAIVVSAGPSLDKNIEVLQKNRDKYVLFTVGTAVKTLYKHNLKPDFLCLIETYDSTRQLEGLDLTEVNFITEPYSHPNLRKFNFKNIFSHIGSNMPVNHFWAKVCGEKIDEYSSRGTVSYTALNCARLLGCSKIILVGQDLAYTEGQCYSRESSYKDLICKFNEEANKWEITAKDLESYAKALSPSEDENLRLREAKHRLEKLNKSLYYVKGIKGDMLPTESVYAAFVSLLSDFTKTYNDRKYINTSLIGAQIDGFENMSLEEALQGAESIGKYEIKTEYKFDENKFQDSLKKELDLLKSAVEYMKKASSVAKGLKNNLIRCKNVNADILKDLKKIIQNYIILTTEYTSKSVLFDFITISNKIDIDYEMKMTTDFNYSAVMNLCTKLFKFYNSVEARVEEIEGLINESIDTKG